MPYLLLGTRAGLVGLRLTPSGWDRGALWWRDGDISAVVVAENSKRIRIHVASDGDYVTDDGGRNWRRATDGRDAVNLEVVPSRWHRADEPPANPVSGSAGTQVGGASDAARPPADDTQVGGDSRIRVGGDSRVGVPSVLRCVAASAENADTLYAGGPDATLLVSYDAGRAWNTLAARGLDGDVNALVADPEAGRLWAGTTHGIFHSLDGGFFWTRATAGLDGLDARAMAATQDGLLAAVHASGARIHRLPQGSARWWPVTERLNGDVLDFAPAPDGTWYVGTTGGSVLATRDAGASWQVIASGLPPIRCAAVVGPDPGPPGQGGLYERS